MAQHPIITVDFDPDSPIFGRVSVLTSLPPPPPIVMSDSAWAATARIRYCHAYCGESENLGFVPSAQLPPFHSVGCAYRTDAWIPRAIELMREVNRG